MADKPDRVADNNPAPPKPALPDSEGKKPFPTPAKNTDVKSQPPAAPTPQRRHPDPTD